MTLLSVSHLKQQQSADCLAACAAMVLEYLQVPVNYRQLLRILRVEYFGAFFRNLQHLESLGVHILIDEGNFDALQKHLETGLPVIVPVITSELPYWDVDTHHAVVVVGIDDEIIYLNDPYFEKLQEIPLEDFRLAWFAKEFLYAVISLDEIIM